MEINLLHVCEKREEKRHDTRAENKSNNTDYISKNGMKIPKFNGDICDFPRLKNDFMMYVMHLSKSGDCAAYVL